MLAALRHSWWWASQAHTKTKSPGRVIGGREGITSSSWEHCLHLASETTLLTLLFFSLLLPSHLCEECSYPDSPFQFPRTAVANDYNPVASTNENLFSNSSESQKSHIKVPAGVVSFGGPEEESITYSSPSFWWPLALLCVPWFGSAKLQSALFVGLGDMPYSFLLLECTLFKG